MSEYNQKNPESPKNVYRIKGSRKKHTDIMDFVYGKWPKDATSLRIKSETYIPETNTFEHVLEYIYRE